MVKFFTKIFNEEINIQVLIFAIDFRTKICPACFENILKQLFDYDIQIHSDLNRFHRAEPLCVITV